MIPDNHFIAVQDHTHAAYLFGDPNSAHTLAEIFRTLKPGGLLRPKEGRCHAEKDIESLRQVGFNLTAVFHSEEGSVIGVTEAQKPF